MLGLFFHAPSADEGSPLSWCASGPLTALMLGWRLSNVRTQPRPGTSGSDRTCNGTCPDRCCRG